MVLFSPSMFHLASGTHKNDPDISAFPSISSSGAQWKPVYFTFFPNMSRLSEERKSYIVI
jgi:hypothetical protein